MSSPSYDVLGIGNAIVDILVQTDDEFLVKQGIEKGAMTLVDADRQKELYDLAGPAVESSGGSAANTLAGVAALGARGAFAGRVRDDQLGTVFRHDISALGVAFSTVAAASGAPTATCLVLITPDGQRTMLTYLGACVNFAPGDLDHDQVRDAKVTYLEGYLWDAPAARESFFDAAKTAKDAGREIALTLSDTFCVDRHRDTFKSFIASDVDILFANEGEILSLFETDDFNQALSETRKIVRLAAVTRSERGSVVVSSDGIVPVAATPVDKVIDTTGAGDAYAAGFLAAYTNGEDLTEAAKLGGKLASTVIQQIGPRPPASVAALRAS